jgi:hypothetical protein
VWCRSQLHGPGERLLGAGEVATAPPDLADFGQGEPDMGEVHGFHGGTRAARSPFAFCPGPAADEDTDAVCLAVSGEGFDPRPGKAVRDRIHPLRGAAVVAEFVTGVDRPAEDDSGGGWRELPVQRPGHPLVHQEEALVDLGLTHEDVALEDEPQRLQVRDAETAAEVEGPPGRLERSIVVAHGEGEHRAGPGVRAQRLALPAASVERDHQLARQSFSKWVFACELRQLAAQRVVPAQGKLGFDAVFEGGEPQVGEPGDLGLRERLEGEVGQRLSTPQGQCGMQQRRRLVRCAAEDQPCLPDQPLEPDGVDPVPIHGQEIAGLPGDHQPAPLARHAVRLEATS